MAVRHQSEPIADPSRLRIGVAPTPDDARALYAATALLMDEGRLKGFHYYALHLRVALMELEPLLAATPMAELPSSLPAAQRRKPNISDVMKKLISGT